MGSTRDFIASSMADAVIPVFRRPVEDIIYETLDGRQVPTRTDFKDIRNTVDALRGQVSSAANAAGTSGERLDAIDARLDAIDARLDAIDARLASLAAASAAKGADKPAAETEPAREGKPARKTTRGKKVCKVEGCGDTARARGFCARHYQQWRRGSLEGFEPPR